MVEIRFSILMLTVSRGKTSWVQSQPVFTFFTNAITVFASIPNICSSERIWRISVTCGRRVEQEQVFFYPRFNRPLWRRDGAGFDLRMWRLLSQVSGHRRHHLLRVRRVQQPLCLVGEEAPLRKIGSVREREAC